MSTSLKRSICNICIKHYSKLLAPSSLLDNYKLDSLEDAGTIHASLSTLPGVFELLREDDDRDHDNDPRVDFRAMPARTDLAHGATSSASFSIIESARVYQTQASGSRLAQAPATYHAHKGLGHLKTRNLDAAAKVKAERKFKYDEAKLLDSGIRITASLWESYKNKIGQVIV